MSLFFVIARVVGREGAIQKWRERLAMLCAVSRTERYSNSYYWAQDIDGEPDTLWGLEGYYHPIGFFIGHVSTDIFKEEMRKVDEDKLLRNVQGLGSPDYDLHHYESSSGFITRQDDEYRDSTESFVVVVHLWAADGKRKHLLGILADYVNQIKASEKAPSITVQSFLVLKELLDFSLASIYIRTKNEEDWDNFQTSGIFKGLLDEVKTVIKKQETHRSKAFIGHINKEASISIL